MYVTYAELKNFRCLKDFKLSFVCGEEGLALPKVTVLVGRNGSGKTSILRGLVIGLIGWALEGYRSYFNVRNGEREAQIALHTKPSRPDEGPAYRLVQEIKSFGSLEKIADPASISPDYVQAMQDEHDPRFFMAGYGVTRRLETGEYDAASREKLRHARYRRVASLLEPQYTLVPLSAWLPRLQRQEQSLIVDIVNKLLPSDGLAFKPDHKGDLHFIHREQRLPFLALSDGYQAFLGWVFDLLFHLHACSFGRVPLDHISGVVLVDEIDLHLHPTWQQEVIGKLSSAFPMLQFVFTTHSPLVVGSVERENVRLLLELEGDIHSKLPPQEVRGLTSDQLLLSPSFGLTSIREASFMQELKETEAKARSGDADAALRFHHMVAYGAAAAPPLSNEEPPEWVREAAARKRSSKGRS